MLLEVCGMPELSIAVGAGEPGLFLVDQEVIVEAVLPGEGGLALVTFEWLVPSMTPEVGQQTRVSCEDLLWITQTTCQVISGGSPGLEILDSSLSQLLVLTAHFHICPTPERSWLPFYVWVWLVHLYHVIIM
mgnify:CR=1 FL=1